MARFRTLSSTFALVVWVSCFTARADVSIPDVLTGEDWQVAVDGLSFCDGLACDAAGNVYFCDLKAKPATIWKLAPDNTKTKVAEIGRSGTKVGPDGKLYACGNKAVTVIDLATGTETVLVEKDVQPNDLIITKTGLIFFTETAKKQITCYNTKTKELKAADVGTVGKPNGIGISPDQSTLLVSDYGGVNVWTFKIGADGSLTDKKAAMTMKTPDGKPSGGDGMTVDASGRAYVTTALGVQVFATNGDLLGILPKPTPDRAIGVGGIRRAGVVLLVHRQRRQDLSSKDAGEGGGVVSGKMTLR